MYPLLPDPLPVSRLVHLVVGRPSFNRSTRVRFPYEVLRRMLAQDSTIHALIGVRLPASALRRGRLTVGPRNSLGHLLSSYMLSSSSG